MPGRDLPLSALRDYRGSRPCPADFHAFWDKVWDRLGESPIELTVEPADLGSEAAEYYRVTVTAPDGAVLKAKYICPKRTQPSALMLQFHDYPQDSRGWFHLTRYPAVGFAVLAPECRGQGGESEAGSLGRGCTSYSPLFCALVDGITAMYLYHLYEDALLWAKAAERLCAPGQQLFAYGEGQGAALAVACASMQPAIQKLGAHYPMLCDFDRVYELDYDTGAYNGLNFYCRWFDPTGDRYDAIFERLAYFDCRNFAPRVCCPSLMSTGLQDAVSPPSAQFALYHALGGEKRHLVYPKHGHELNNFFENELLKFLLAGKE